VKATTVVLSLSLLANIGCLAWIATESSTPSARAKASPPSAAVTAGSANSDTIRIALASGNAAELEAAGVSADVARDLALGRSFSRLAEKVRAAQNRGTGDGQWWKSRGAATSTGREHQLLARRELADALIAAFGHDLGVGGGDQSQLGFLSPEKREALRRIIQDYDEMMAKFGASGIQLASDREKLRLLRQERDRDIAALLSPDELLAYEMRTSVSGNSVRARYGDAIQSEAEFQKIFALQKAFDEKFPREAMMGRISPETMRARAEAERQLEADIRASVGDDRYAALRRAADPDARTIDSIASRLNLAPSTADLILASRTAYSAESQRILNDTSVPMPDRRSQIQALATKAKSELTRTLGAEGADAYAQRSPWMSMLQNGMAYSTTPPDAHGSMVPGMMQSVYPVMPPGAVQGAARQFVMTADAPIGGSDAVNSSVQVMTFSTSSTTDTAPSGGAGVRQLIVAPGATPPAQPAPATALTPKR
jgi:hypothetical protein